MLLLTGNLIPFLFSGYIGKNYSTANLWNRTEDTGGDNRVHDQANRLCEKQPKRSY